MTECQYQGCDAPLERQFAKSREHEAAGPMHLCEKHVDEFASMWVCAPADVPLTAFRRQWFTLFCDEDKATEAKLDKGVT